MRARYHFEEYLAEGVIIMTKRIETEGNERIFQIEEMKGLNHDPKARPYAITADGIRVYPME